MVALPFLATPRPDRRPVDRSERDEIPVGRPTPGKLLGEVGWILVGCLALALAADVAGALLGWR